MVFDYACWYCFIMNIEEFVVSLNKTKKLSEVKLKILRELWCNQDFPGDWVASSHLLEITNQKYFDRRIRELRDEHGVDLEQTVIDGEHSYRLVSAKIGQTNTRAYLSNSNKAKLFNAQQFTCQICGKICSGGSRGLQADHKVPLTRGGSNELENWQSLCSECNVAKRRSCQNCLEDCFSCELAFPEKVGFKITVKVNSKIYDAVNLKLRENKQWLVDLLSANLKL